MELTNFELQAGGKKQVELNSGYNFGNDKISFFVLFMKKILF